MLDSTSSQHMTRNLRLLSVDTGPIQLYFQHSSEQLQTCSVCIQHKTEEVTVYIFIRSKWLQPGEKFDHRDVSQNENELLRS